VLLAAVMFVLVNLITDLCYAVINPRSAMSNRPAADQREWTWRRLRRYRQVLIGAPLVALLVLAALAAPLLVAHSRTP